MSGADRVRRAFVPISLAIFSVGFGIIAAINFTDVDERLGILKFICFFIPAAVYSVISVLAMSDVISKDGATVLSVLLIPVLITFVFFFLMFAFSIGIEGIS